MNFKWKIRQLLCCLILVLGITGTAPNEAHAIPIGGIVKAVIHGAEDAVIAIADAAVAVARFAGDALDAIIDFWRFVFETAGDAVGWVVKKIGNILQDEVTENIVQVRFHSWEISSNIFPAAKPDFELLNIDPESQLAQQIAATCRKLALKTAIRNGIRESGTVNFDPAAGNLKSALEQNFRQAIVDRATSGVLAALPGIRRITKKIDVAVDAQIGEVSVSVSTPCGWDVTAKTPWDVIR